jgi:tetratricopeptide (TPR) repeat protein
MRFLFPVLALLIAGASILVDFAGAPPASRVCVFGFCRFDQIFSKIDSEGINLANQGALLNLDPSNPLAWCAYAELLAAAGRREEAHDVFQRAISFGPRMAPVLVRAANFDFAHGYENEGLGLAHRILNQTEAFDEIIFSYLTRSGKPVSGFLGTALPANRRAAQAWIIWLDKHGSEQDLLATWSWMKTQRLASQSSAVRLAGILWDRKSYRAAQDLWADWLGPTRDGYPNLQRLANRHFEEKPGESPFDWAALGSLRSVRIIRHDGLEIQFLGQENIEFSGAREFTAVPPGRYRFSAEIQGEGLSTDQGAYFRIFNPSGPGVNVQTSEIKGDVGRSWIKLDFQVPVGSEALEIQIERHASQKFDNKIVGTLHVYQVSLVPFS